MRLLLAAALSLLTLPFLSVSAAYAAPSSIDIDGDQDGVATDWEGHAVSPGSGFTLIEDGINPDDASGFDGGNSENDYDGLDTEKGWAFDAKGTPSGKSDIGNVLVDSYRNGANHLILALGWDRGSGVGTQNYWIELNQLEHSQIMPPRTVGDLRINLDINGSATQECQSAQLWTGTQWGASADCDTVTEFGVNTAPVRDYFGSGHASGTPPMLPANQFFELTVDLTALGATSCPVSGFSTFNMRTQEGNENGETSRLKDLAQGGVDIPSDCGTLKIVKKDAATGLPVTVPGAAFSISPNPTPGAQDQTAKTVVDNNTAPADLQDADPAPGKITLTGVKPGVSYTVTEIAAPTGYFLPAPCVTDAEDADRCTKKAMASGETVTFTFTDKRRYDAPTVTKNAVATFDAAYTWDVAKAVKNPGGTFGESATQNVPEGTSATFDYGVTVTEVDKRKTGYEVHGTVTVKNPNALPMTVTLSDVLSDGTVCTFPNVADVSGADGLQVSLPADVATGYGYVCAPGADPQDGTNTATVVWSLAAYPQTEQQAWSQAPGTGEAAFDKSYSYVVDQETDKVVTITDNHHTFDPAWVNTWGQGDNPETRYYQKQFAGVAGTCTGYDNTATITQTNQRDSATATVCVGRDLTVTKNVVASLTRTYAFGITKSAADTTLDVDPVTGKARASYTVTVTDGPAADSLWVMKGSITVSNPNDWQSVTLTGVTDAYEGDAESCEVDKSAGLTVPKSGSKVYPYTCTFEERPAYDGTNVATATWDRAAAATPSGSDTGGADVVEADWDLTEVGKTVTIVDDKTVPGAVNVLGTHTWTGQGHTEDFRYSLDLAGAPGQCIDHDNIAAIKETGQPADETVTVCAPLGVSVEKTAGGTYDRTYLWDIDKDAEKTQVEIDGGSYTFDYTVTATPDGFEDGGYTMGGTITVKNPNTFKTMTVDITDVPSVGGGAVCTVTDGDDVVIGKASVVDGKVVPATAVRDYGCSFASKPTYSGGTNTAIAAWDGGSAASVPTAVSFMLDEETDKTISVVDDKTVEGAVNQLGTATWTNGPKEFEYSLTKQGVAGECTTYDNTATIVETEQDAEESVTLCVEAPLQVSKTVTAEFDRTYLWTIAKAADKTELEILDGGTARATYTVTVDPTTYADSGWTMTGTISVTNPNSEDVGSITADVTDAADVGGSCVVAAGEDVEIMPGERVDLTYRCSFGSAGPSRYTGTNTATATWSGNGGTRTSTGTAPVSFTIDDEVDKVVDVTDLFDDATLPGGGTPEALGTADWFAGQKQLVYSRDLPGVAGTCVEHDNTATIVQTGQTADETVKVCSQAGAGLAGTVAANHDRIYNWAIAKAAGGTTFSAGDSGTAKVGYTVTATPSGSVDTGWTMGGSLTVTNPNDYKSLTVTVGLATTLGAGTSCALTPGQDLQLPAGTTRTFSYSCSFGSQPAYTATGTATVTWDTGTARLDLPVTFVLDQETNKVVDVVDDQTVPGQVVPLGQATWNAEGTPTPFTYTLDLAAQANECEDYTNTAAIVQTAQSAQATVQVCGPEILPAEEVAPRPPVVIKGEEALPNTGGPSGILLWSGVGMVLLGGALVLVRRRKVGS